MPKTRPDAGLDIGCARVREYSSVVRAEDGIYRLPKPKTYDRGSRRRSIASFAAGSRYRSGLNAWGSGKSFSSLRIDLTRPHQPVPSH